MSRLSADVEDLMEQWRRRRQLEMGEPGEQMGPLGQTVRSGPPRVLDDGGAVAAEQQRLRGDEESYSDSTMMGRILGSALYGPAAAGKLALGAAGIPGMAGAGANDLMNLRRGMMGEIPDPFAEAAVAAPRAIGELALGAAGVPGMAGAGIQDFRRMLVRPQGQGPVALTPLTSQSQGGTGEFVGPQEPMGPFPNSAQEFTGPMPRAPWDDSNSHLSTIRNASGDLLQQMRYGLNQDGSYQTGQLTARKAGYGPTGEWENQVMGGVDIGRGPLTPEQQFEDLFQKHLSTRRGNPADAWRMALQQTAAAAPSREVASRQMEGQLNRQHQMDLAEMNNAAGRYDHTNREFADNNKAYMNALAEGNAGPLERAFETRYGANWRQSAFGQGGRQQTGPAVGSVPSAGQGPATERQVRPDERVNQFLKNALDISPDKFKFIPQGGGDKQMPLAGSAPEFGPSQQREWFNRMAANQFDEPSTNLLVEKLKSTPGGEQILNSLVARRFSDDIAMRNQPQARASVVGKVMGSLFPPLGRLTGIGRDTYGAELDWPEEKHGAKARATGQTFGLGNVSGVSLQGGMPSYDLFTEQGQRIPLDMKGSFSLLDQGQINDLAKSTEPTRRMFAEALFRKR